MKTLKRVTMILALLGLCSGAVSLINCGAVYDGSLFVTSANPITATFWVLGLTPADGTPTGTMYAVAVSAPIQQ